MMKIFNGIDKLYPFFILAPLYVFLVVIFFWLYQTTFTYPTGIITTTIINPVVKAGDSIITDASIDRESSCHLNRTHFLVNSDRSIRVGSDDYYINNESLVAHLQNIIPIPSTLAPGVFDFVTQVNYFCNPMDYIFSRHRLLNYGKVTILNAGYTKKTQRASRLERELAR